MKKSSSETMMLLPRAGIEPTSLGFMSECDTTTLYIKTTLLATQPSNRYVGYINLGDRI